MHMESNYNDSGYMEEIIDIIDQKKKEMGKLHGNT
uniref:Uncharacterized protein n=1 Tax=Rhizophora mucronata TaxID=61149 RepID=A0A2P2PC91_RHIMU